MTWFFFSSFKTLLTSTEHTLRQSTSRISLSLAGFQVIPYGRFWVIPEETYEIRLYATGWDFKVQAYYNDRPANGYAYLVNLPTAINLNDAWGLEAVQLLIRHAKRDITEDTWRQHVEHYVAGLNKTPEEALGCRKCGSRKVGFFDVDRRKMYVCSDCDSVWYEVREWTGPVETVVDDITEGVEKNGSHEIDASILLNCAFTRGSFDDQLRNWANQNRLKYERRGPMVSFTR